jgi:putative hemolysin
MHAEQTDLLDFRELSEHPMLRALLGGGQRMAEPLLKTAAVNAAYRRFLESRRSCPEMNFFDCGLLTLGVRYRLQESDLSRVPASGPLLLLANHPYGGVDGLILGSLLQKARGDGKLLVNALLDRIDHMGGSCFYVNPFGGAEAARQNIRGLRDGMKWLKGGGALATFPAGEVSHIRLRSRQVTDPQWVENIAQLIRRTGATVVPVYFSGHNSRLFQWLGMMHPRLRTALLPREMLRMAGQEIEVRIGNPIAARRMQHFSSDREMMDFIRLRTYILQNRAISEKTTFIKDARKAYGGVAVMVAQDPGMLEEEIADLPPQACLLHQGDYSVYIAKASEIPRVVLELGRLRELTFRAVGEGTGRDRDLDRFDSTYRHLFVWHAQQRCIVGAYRLGLTDEILPAAGKSGLYSATLFRYAPGVLSSLNPAIELGRSFVVEAYQRKPQSLSLLWKGIGRFIVQHPRYKTLFGPVSISKEYESLSKNLMVTYLREHTLDPRLARWVRAKKPPRSRFFGSLDRGSFRRSVRNIEDVSALIAEIETEEKGVPVLLRQYLKLNATMLSFNVDPDFNDCIDGLVLVDLRRTAPKVLAQYMGAEGAQSFVAYHQTSAAARRVPAETS